MNIQNKIIATLIGVVCALLFFLNFKCNQVKQQKVEVARLNQNIKALNDSVRVTTNKVGDTEYNKLSFVVNKLSELESLNKSLAEKVKNIKGSVVYVSNVGATTKTDSSKLNVKADSSGSNLSVNFKLDTVYSEGNYRKLDGSIQIGKDTTGTLTTDVIGFTATTGLKKTAEGDYEIFFQSDYPGMSVTKLDGAFIPRNLLKADFKQKKKPLSFGLQLGYSPLSYDLSTKKLDIKNQFTAGVGVTFKF